MHLVSNTLALSVMTTLLAASSVVGAQQVGDSNKDDDCPDGAWVCDSENDSQGAGKSQPGEELPSGRAPQPLPPGEYRPPSTRRGATRIYPKPEGPPIYPQREAPPIYRRAQPPSGDYQPSSEPLPPPPPPPPLPPKPRHRWRKWGTNLHLSFIGLGAGAADGSGLAGLGAAFRFRPLRHFGFDFGIDLIGGRDYQGHSRVETPVTATALMYVNPRNASQLYFLAGLGWSTARVRVPAVRGGVDLTERYAYFGGHLGIGMEFRVTRLVSINADVLGFIRDRVDANAAIQPEFIDPDTGVATNSSGGAMVRTGVTLYW